jgi:hypothetical protein
MFRNHDWPDLESLVAAMILYMRVRPPCEPEHFAQVDAEQESMFSQAVKRYERRLTEELVR